jgi:hypothetical protein
MANLLSEADFTDYLGIDEPDPGLLRAAIAGATSAITKHTLRTYDPVGTSTASARVYEVIDPQTLAVDDFADDDGLVVRTDDDDDGVFETTWVATGLEPLPLGARMDDGTVGAYTQLRAVGTRRFPVLTTRFGVVEVTARWGWPAVPDDVTEAARLIAKDLYNGRHTQGGLLVDQGTGAVLAIRRNSLAAMLLAPYVRHDRARRRR